MGGNKVGRDCEWFMWGLEGERWGRHVPHGEGCWVVCGAIKWGTWAAVEMGVGGMKTGNWAEMRR